MEQAKDQRGRLGVGLEPKPFLERSKVVQRLVDDRKADDRVDDVGVDAPAEPHAQKHSNRVADGEEADVNRHILHVIQKEHDTKQKQNVIVSRHHVLCAQIDERDDMHPEYLLDIACVAGGHVMGIGRCCECDQHQNESDEDGQRLAQKRRLLPRLIRPI